MNYVAYYRVSTAKQGVSGLGLEAQKASVLAFTRGLPILAEFTDVESGKHDNRPELTKALQFAKANNATLLIAKLDRLSRNVTFISTLIDTHVKFTCCDMPEANELTIHLMAALAQWERKAISTRTREALAAKKAKGHRLGMQTGVKGIAGKIGNLDMEARKAGVATIRRNAAENENNRRARAMVSQLRSQGQTLQEIADALNASGFKTSRGLIFKTEQVRRLCPITEAKAA